MRKPLSNYLPLRNRRRPGSRVTIAALLSAAVGVPSALAANQTYLAPQGLWSTEANWSAGVLPSAPDAVQLGLSGSNINVVTFDSSSDDATVTSLVTDYIGGDGLSILTQSSKALSTTTEQVGLSGMGVLNLVGGTHDVTGAGSNGLFIGFNSGSSGTMNLSGTKLNVADSTYVGYSGNGIVNQSGGKFTSSSFLVLGGESTGTATAGTGTYNLSGGTLIAGTLYVGLSGAGSFSHSDGSALYGGISIGTQANSVGSYNLDGGSAFTMGTVIVGDQGTGVFSQTGGTHNNSGLTLGYASTGAGTLQLSGGSFTVQGPEIIGSAGTGSLQQSGGSHTASSLYAALQPTSIVDMTLNDGTLKVTGNEYLGYAGSATFIQNGGAHTIGNYLSVGRLASSSASYTLNGGILTCPNQSFGYSSAALTVFTQTGGSNIASNTLQLGELQSGQGQYDLQNGTLSTATLFVGNLGLGLLTQSGGSINTKDLIVGSQRTSTGTFQLSGGTLNSTGLEAIGSSGVGTFNQNGGVHTASGTMSISNLSGGNGVYNLMDGVLNTAAIVNKGNLNISGGVASLGKVSGSGTTTISGNITVQANALSQSRLTISDLTTLQLNTSPTRVTNTISSLELNTGGSLDLNNHNLLTNTPAATVRQYLTNGYNADGSGIGRWNGTGGISSSLAAAAYVANPLNPKFSVGYATVADNATTHLGLTGNQVLVKPTIPGDATLDGLVDIGDLNVVLSNYLSGNPARWGTGDFTYAGRTDITDLNIVLSNYFATSPYPSAASSAATPSAKTATSSAATLTGTPVASSATSAPVTANTVELDVDPVSGDVKLNGNGAKIASIQITSNGHLVPLSWNSLGDQGVPNWTDATDRTTTGLAEYDFKFNTKHDSKLINGVIDYGNIFSPGAAQDLVFQYGLVQPDGTTLSTITGNVVYAPEPTSLSLLGLGAIGLLKRRNRKAKGN
jgi:autotransporter family porin